MPGVSSSPPSLVLVVVVSRCRAVNSRGGSAARGSRFRGGASSAGAPTARSRADTRRCGTAVTFESRTRVSRPLLVRTEVIDVDVAEEGYVVGPGASTRR